MKLNFSRKPLYSSNSTQDLTAVFLVGAVVLTAVAILSPDLAQAATHATNSINGDKELTQAFSNIKGLIAGTAGKIIAITSFLFGLAASIFKFNMAAIAGSFGVSLAASLGPGMIESVVGATF